MKHVSKIDEEKNKYWKLFGPVSLFRGISTYECYLMPKPPL